MHILVTGSTGFIGASLCRALVAKGHQVRAFHRPTSPLRLIDDLLVEHCLGDLTQPDTLVPAMKGIEAVFHTAAMLVSGQDEEGRMYAVTVEGTRSVLKAARQAGVRRLVYTSSVASLGIPELVSNSSMDAVGKAAYMNESHTWNLRPDFWPYGYSKYLAELEVQKAIAEGLDAVIVNPTYVMGPGDIYRQTNSTLVQAARQKIPALVEGGLNIVHISDVVAGHLAALEIGRTGERYILAGENLTIVELIRKIAAVAGVTAPTLVLPGEVVRSLGWIVILAQSLIDLPISARLTHLAGYSFYFDNTKSQIELRLQPPCSADQAILDAYNWFVQVGALPQRKPA
ncbi:MAG: NAD-dependent epimerase/dehydratase family protein [Anaerolineaceae bacterium]|nr:NAD-dependent epimerase/dehydratase family protein [Anaerolineaceae bacterium]